ncbi:hypothetical protein KGM_211823 [Danaus plexippus plexippus]|uniref:Ig-like domain-containing protein n=1 Tax=Danaus plexippus plexippus TaxID=278856 RepID=A0A212EUM1_DANPL|nr:hypothetical protein KGM_211823 [Danaus plexippus plexippus]
MTPNCDMYHAEMLRALDGLPSTRYNNHTSRRAEAIRNTYAQLFDTTEAVPWQGFFPGVFSERSSSERAPAPLDAVDILRDAPLYPPLRDNYEDNTQNNENSNELSKQEPDTNLPFFDTENSIDVSDYDTETNIEDGNVLVTPGDPNDYDNNKLDNLFETDFVKDKNTILSSDNIIENEISLEEENNSNNLQPEQLKDSQSGFIVAPASDVDELNKILMAEEARVEAENKRFILQELNSNYTNPPVTSTDTLGDSEENDRKKRSSGQEWDKPAKSRRVKTGDTILNIRGAVRDAIGDAGAAPGLRASSRVDAFVIRPSPVMRDEPREQMREMRREKVPPPQPQKQEKELLVEPHARARILCDLVNVTNLRWYKDSELINLPSSPGGGDAWRDGDAVEIPRASRGHAARWRCAARDRSGRTVTGEPTRLLIYEPVRSVYLAVDGRRLDAGNTWVPVRDKTVLEVRCVAEGGVPPPELSWRLLALEPALDHRPYLRIHPTNYSIDGVYWSRVVVTAARELHNATLQCSSRQRRAAPSPDNPGERPPDHLTAKLEIHVTYPPSFVISRWPGFGVALVAGGAAALRCDVDANPPARATWMKDTERPSSSPPTPLESGAAGSPLSAATLRWSVLSESHAGWYRCRAKWMDTDYSSIGYYLNVMAAAEEVPQTGTEPGADEEVEHQKVEVQVGGSVQLHCPRGTVGCWWRRIVGNGTDAWTPAGSHHAHGVLDDTGVKDALYEEAGEYRCIGARAPDMKVLRELKRVTLKVTGSATATAVSAEATSNGYRLECGACGRNLRVLWLRGGVTTPAILTPGLAQHCWRAVILVPDPDETWCVAVTSVGGAVAVFPRRSVQTPARHAVRALHSNVDRIQTSFVLLWALVLLHK